MKRSRIGLLLALALAGCGIARGPGTAVSPPSFAGEPTAATLAVAPLAAPAPCTGAFVAHTLPHSTDVRGERVHMFDSNGAGLALGDLDGNDFEARDQIWLRRDGGWEPAEPFTQTTENTMSIDQGDIDNDGHPELYAVDMKPYDVAVSTMASWLPLMATMPTKHDKADPQVVESVLQVPAVGGGYANEAYARGVNAVGWGWSAKFGDLDRDGQLDLYAVNGMVAAELFGHLPGDELVEQNQALRNDGGRFRPAPEWGLGSTLSGRGMSMGDLDGDGDLDIVVNNLRGPAQLFENRLCGGGSVLVELRWPGSGNTRAVGARLALHTSAGSFYRDVRAASGYLSGDPPQAHFGVPAGATVERLEVRWPDGTVSVIPDPQAHALLTITREEQR